MSVVDVVAAVAILLGAALGLVAALGVLRFPDVLARMHAATKPATLGLVLVAIGAALRLDDLSDLTKLTLVVALQFLTAPVGAHLVGRAAYTAGVGREELVRDDLAGGDEPQGGSESTTDEPSGPSPG